MKIQILIGDVRERLKWLAADSFNCIVTSPPYYALRSYGVDGQIGLEETPEAYVQTLVEVFRAARRVLRDDGTLWLNLGDSYGKGKQLLGMPWRVALALQADGWILRSSIIWHKPNPMPESVKDRPTNAHETVFLFAKSERYHYDADAVREPLADDRAYGSWDDRKAKGAGSGNREIGRWKPERAGSGVGANPLGRNLRNVWTITPKPFPGAHFAVFPPALVEPCIKAGCPEGGTVLDLFGGSGTTGIVARRLGRNAVLIELNPDYVTLAWKRIGLEPVRLLVKEAE